MKVCYMYFYLSFQVQLNFTYCILDFGFIKRFYVVLLETNSNQHILWCLLFLLSCRI